MDLVHSSTSDHASPAPPPRSVLDRPVLVRYGVATVTVVAAFLGRSYLETSTGIPSLFLTFLGAVIVSAWFGGLGPGLFTTFLGAFLTTLQVPDPIQLGWIARLGLFVAEGIAISVGMSVLQRALHRSELSILQARRHQETLRRAEERFRGLLESAPDAMVIVDVDGTIVLMNSQAERLFGYGRDELLGQSIEMLVPAHLRATHVQLRQGYGVHPVTRPMGASLNLHAVRKDGIDVPVEISLAPLQTERGVLVTAAIRDISDRRRVAEELSHAKEAAEEANRAKDRFLAVLSHELRTPLTPALLTAAALQSSAEIPAGVRDDLELIRRNIELESRLIDDLLDVTRIAHGKLMLRFETVDVHQLIDSAVRTSQRDARDKNLNVQLILRATASHVRGDPARLHQVLWNLLNNAIKFTPAGGTISVRTRNEEYVPVVKGAGLPPPLQTKGNTPNDRFTLMIDVIDTGIGIPPEAIPKLFAPFEQADASITQRFGGLGLGLVICKGLMELHNGSIAASSPGPNQGATFTVSLPTAPAPTSTAPLTAPPETAERRVKILLVEDHPDTLRTMARLLRAAHHEVTPVASVSAAIAAAGTQDFDLLVSDIGLPDGSGCDLMRQLKSDHPALNGIALTGYGMEDDIESTRRAGFAAHITKPIVITQLLATIQKLAAGAETVPARPAPAGPGPV